MCIYVNSVSDELWKWTEAYSIGLGKDFSLKFTILLHDLHIEILTVVEYNLYA